MIHRLTQRSTTGRMRRASPEPEKIRRRRADLQLIEDEFKKTNSVIRVGWYPHTGMEVHFQQMKLKYDLSWQAKLDDDDVVHFSCGDTFFVTLTRFGHEETVACYDTIKEHDKLVAPPGEYDTDFTYRITSNTVVWNPSETEMKQLQRVGWYKVVDKLYWFTPKTFELIGKLIWSICAGLFLYYFIYFRIVS